MLRFVQLFYQIISQHPSKIQRMKQNTAKSLNFQFFFSRFCFFSETEFHFIAVKFGSLFIIFVDGQWIGFVLWFESKTSNRINSKVITMHKEAEKETEEEVEGEREKQNKTL